MPPLFDPDLIDEIGQRHIGKPLVELVVSVGADLRAKFGDRIHLDQPLFFNSGGGILYQIKLFALTPGEYVLIRGTSIPASSHPRRHPVAFWDTILMGEARTRADGEAAWREHAPGARMHVDRWQSAAVDYPDYCWMLEYARGAMITLLPRGLANTAFETFDLESAFRTLRIYGTLVRRHLSMGRL